MPNLKLCAPLVHNTSSPSVNRFSTKTKGAKPPGPRLESPVTEITPSIRPAPGKNWSSGTDCVIAPVSSVREKLIRTTFSSVGDKIRLSSRVMNWECEVSASGQNGSVAFEKG